MSDRNRYFDFLRGVAILMVIGIHTFIPEKIISSGFNFAVLVRQVFNVAVPLFLALSGFFLYRKPLNSKEAVSTFWRRQIPKHYIPVLIWSLPLFAIDIIARKSVLLSVLKLLVCGYSIYYFVALIIQYYLLLPVLQKVKLRGGGIIVSLSGISIIVVTYFNIFRGMNLPLILYAGCFVLWGVFYYLGCRLSVSDRNYSLWLPIAITFVGLILSYVESLYLVSNYGSGYGIKFSSFVFSAGVILLFLSSKLERVYPCSFLNRFIEWVGRNSFFIYLFHCYIVIALDRIPIELPWIARWIIVVTSSVAIAEGFKCLPPRIRYYIGSYD